MYSIALTAITSGLAILREIQRLVLAGIKTKDRQALNAAIQALRELFFFDDMTKDLLLYAASGNEISPERIERALVGLSLTEDRISEAITNIENLAETPHAGMSVNIYNKLRGLAGHKLDVREAVRMFLYELSEPTSDVGKTQERMDFSAALVEMIAEINARIVEIDDGLRSIISK